MSTVFEQQGLPETRARWVPWLALAIGLAALYVPTYLSLAQGLWQDDDYAHGPIILAVFAWLVWRERAALVAATRPAPIAGAVLLASGLALYVLGRSLALTVFEVASHIPVLAGLVLLMRGTEGLKRFGFAIAFLFFLIPLPGFILDWFTTPLKEMVSVAVAGLLGAIGYPIERAGVVLQLGDSQMLVADACSGMNSIYSLFALGLIYAWLTPPRTRLRMAVLLAAVLPIAIAANIVRVAALVLVTHHFGEEAAQGFLHGFAGILIFLVAIGLLVGVDKLCSPLWANASGAPAADRPATAEKASVPKWVAFAGVAMLVAAIAVPVLKPVPTAEPIDLEHAIPVRFGDWQLDPEMVPIAPTTDVQARLDRIYRQVISRTYVNSAGERIMLMVAHGGDQSDALKAHRQEKCYEAQGFDIAALGHGRLTAAKRDLPVTRMVAVRGERVEPVTYWFTMGDRVVLGRAERLQVQVASGLKGRIPDGMLVRVSSISEDPDAAFAAQERFASAIFNHVAATDTARFVGAVRS